MSSYLNHWRLPQAGEMGWQESFRWEDFTARRLAWLYGEARASLIRKGADPETQADIARWNTLGRRNAA